jgi:hypothetical protein
MTNTTAITVNIQTSTKGVRITPEYSNRGRFSMTKQFNLKEVKDKRDPDLLDLLGSMSKGERDLFLLIKDHTSYKTNRATIDTKNLTVSQTNKRSKHLSGLIKLDLVKKVNQGKLTNSNDEIIHVKVGTYMINPEYIKPSDKFADEIYHQWFSL